MCIRDRRTGRSFGQLHDDPHSAGGSKLGQRERREVENAMALMAKSALRVLGFAVSRTPEKGERELCFLGLAGMQDPPRPEVKQAVRKLSLIHI